MIRIAILSSLLAICFLSKGQTSHQSSSTSDSESGKLMLLGGGILDIHTKLFLKFSGGDTAKIVVIPTALSDEEINKDPIFSKIKTRFKKLGIENISIFHTRMRSKANDEEFIRQLKEATGIFLLGGRTQNLTDAYLNTRVHEIMKALLNRGGIIAGVSAGSGAQAVYFDSEKQLQKGFEFLEGVVIMNHFLAKGKQFKYTDEINQNRKDYISIGIDDATAILVQGNRFEVIGKSYVAIYDGTNYFRLQDSIVTLPTDSERFYLLKNGDRYNLKKKQIESNNRLTPLSLSTDELKAYSGKFKSITNNFSIDFLIENNSLKVKNSWGWEPYPIFAFKSDIFFATNRNMWFQFIRNTKTNEVIGVKKMRSIIQEHVIVELKKLE